jgi:FtsH-binding integral membrane protein
MALAHSRPIDGAVATLGVSERVAFLRKTYAHLGIALLAWVGFTTFLFRATPEFSLKFSQWALNGRWNWFLVIAAFMAVGWITSALARSEASRGIQYLGLGLGVAAEALILQPLLWVLFINFANQDPTKILLSAALVTAAIFVGLTLTVFVTKKDFSFLRGILMIGMFAALGVILASLAFGFQLGAIFCGAMILLMAGYILYQTSLVMQHYPPSHYVSAALMLFSTIATLFWYVLQLMMELNRR